MYVRKIICLLLSAVLICFCLGSCSSGKKDDSSSELDPNVPNIVLPELPLSINAFDGTITVQSIKINNDFDSSKRSVSGSFSMKLESSQNGDASICKVNYTLLNENGVTVDAGTIGKETKNVGDVYEGEFKISGVFAGKKYTMKLFGN
jgi:hypothetical protein